MTVEKRAIEDFFTARKQQKKAVLEEDLDSSGEGLKVSSTQCSKVSVGNVEKVSKLVYTSRKKIAVKAGATSTAPVTSTKSDVPFDRAAFIASLDAATRALLELEISTMDPSWFEILHSEFTQEYFLDLKRFLEREWQSPTDIFPPRNDIYSWTRLTPLSSVRVLILGQDPYHNFNQAHGLAFSVKDPNTRVPPSLVNIYKAVKADYDGFEVPKTGDLTRWAQQGVLLLNTCLTVQAHKANSHAKKGWERFTRAVVAKLLGDTPDSGEAHSKAQASSHGIVVMAWGAPALKLVQSFAADSQRHLLLSSAHPSPLSARRGFFEGHHFRKCNEWLASQGAGEVDWGVVAGNSTSSGL